MINFNLVEYTIPDSQIYFLGSVQINSSGHPVVVDFQVWAASDYIDVELTDKLSVGELSRLKDQWLEIYMKEHRPTLSDRERQEIEAEAAYDMMKAGQ